VIGGSNLKTPTMTKSLIVVLALAIQGQLSQGRTSHGRSLLPEFKLRPPTGKKVDCPCSDKTLCDPITNVPTKEIFGFGANNYDEGSGFDFDIITTIAWASGIDLICEAHAAGVRIIAGVSPPLTDNQTAIDEFIAETIQSIQENYLDGVTFDYESAVTDSNDPINTYYLNVVSQTTAALKQVHSGYQTSVCAAWDPHGIDGRWYDYVGLAEASDFLYVMCYDTRSQIFDRCTASANAPWPTCRHGVEDFLEMGISPQKLVLGLPWYGYRYECINPSSPLDDTCNIAMVPFRDVNCSDAAGSEIAYGSIRDIVNGGLNSTPVKHDSYLHAPYFNYVDETSGKLYQVWYDDPSSLAPIYEWARDQGLRGTGPYRFDQLDPVGNPTETQNMWDAIATFLD
jgi:Di-N-acetylchitobiase